MIRVLFCFTVILHLVSCQTNKKLVTTQGFTADTTTIVYDGDFTANYTGGLDLLTRNESSYMVFNYCGDNTIKVLDQNNSQFDILNAYNPDCNLINTRITNQMSYLLGEDNILKTFNNQHPNKVICELHLDSIEEFYQSGLTTDWYKAGGDQHVETPDNIIFFRVNLSLDRENGKFSDYNYGYPVVGKLNLKDTTVSFYGKISQFISDDLYGLHSEIFDLYVKNNIYLSNGVNGEVIRFNTEINEIDTFNCVSSNDDVSIEQLVYPADVVNKKDVKMQHALTQPHYSSLFYNPYKLEFYRIFYPYLAEKDKNGLLNTSLDKKCFLMVFDENLSIKDEFELPYNSNRIFKLIPTKNGVKFYIPELFSLDNTKFTIAFLNVEFTD